jgi:hypothetical protein
MDFLFAFLAFAAFAAFMGIVAVKVARFDLSIVIAIGIALVVCDLWSQLAPRRR